MMDGQIVSTLGDIAEVFGPLCKSHTCTHARTHAHTQHFLILWDRGLYNN